MPRPSAALPFAYRLAGKKTYKKSYSCGSGAVTMGAAEIKVLSTHAVFEVLGELAPQFERLGIRPSIHYDPANAIKRLIEAGANFDVAIVTPPVVEQLAREGNAWPGSQKDLARSGLGISVRKGAPKPELGSVEAFKRALLAAKSLVRSRDGSSGVYFESLLTRLGIAEAMRGKITLGGSGRVAEFVARGEVEMAVQQISELVPVKGADYAGPFPPELQLYTMFSACIGTACGNREAAQGLIDAMAAPATAALYTKHGLEPVAR